MIPSNSNPGSPSTNTSGLGAKKGSNSNLTSLGASTVSLRDKQIECLQRMLNLNRPVQESHLKETWDEPWKILVYDDYCRDIISPLLRVGDLRNMGITLHMSINTERQVIPDVPAIYFIMPTKENIKRVCEDFRNHLYDSYHFNFCSSISRDLLEELATAALETESASQVSKIFDQYLNFLSLERDLFSLAMKNSFIAFNDPTLNDIQAERNIETTVDALFSVLVTLGVVPIIRAPKNGAAEAVATQLDTKIHDHLNTVGNLFADTATSFQRPVLIIVDRNVDLSVMLNHTWTYQPLVHDLLKLNLNKVTVEVSESDGIDSNSKKESKVFDLDSNADSFWSSNADSPFPKIAVEVKSYINEYKAALDEFNKLSGGVDIDQYDESQILGRTKELGSFVSAIPLLREKKRIIDVHTNIATALLNEIKAREIDSFFSIEEDILSRGALDKKELLSLLSDSKRGTEEDKLRLLLIFYLSNDNIPQNEMESYEEALRKQNIDLGALKYVKKTKAFHKSLTAAITPSNATLHHSSSMSSLRGLMSKVNVNVESLGFGGSVSQQLTTLFNAGVKALLPTSKELYVTRVVDSIMELKSDPVTGVDNYLYFDPKIQKKMRQSSIPRKNTPFREAIVFVVGGGNYVEFQNLQEYAKKQPTKRIIYGTTELLTATQFIAQLQTLSK